ncbi:helix-turn-helix transcriptional regulator [Paludibaculum fermentans]|uniref:helix-turn-helix transcriptional regulator n=1 Tax=Paludibaculum fermentans TaxID=1473598 RepID=UPI003EBE29E0
MQDALIQHDLHAHFAMQLTVGLLETVSLRIGYGEPEGFESGWLTGSGQCHLMECSGATVVILIDPLSQIGQRLRARLHGLGQAPLSEAECEIVRGEFERGRQGRWDVPSVRAAVAQIVDLLAPGVIAADPIDPRVRSAIESLRLESDENISLADLAARAGLSESRFAHLFRRDVGLPMRQYRLSLRIEEAFTQIALGFSLTEAAHAAGFSDSAQFCRICRRMFGSAPSCLPDFETEDAHRP